MQQEREEDTTLEEERIKMNIFANNPELYQKLFKETTAENIEDVTWISPESIQEATDLANILESMHVGSEEIE